MLHLAAHYGWMETIIDQITNKKCDTNCKDSDGRTPLHYAAINNHQKVVRYFINKQYCDPMTRDNDGDAPLHLACHYTSSVHIDISTLPSTSSVRHNVTHHVRTRMVTPLHLACYYGHLNITKYLISEAHCNHYALLVTIATPTLYNTCYLMAK